MVATEHAVEPMMPSLSNIGGSRLSHEGGIVLIPRWNCEEGGAGVGSDSPGVLKVGDKRGEVSRKKWTKLLPSGQDLNVPSITRWSASWRVATLAGVPNTRRSGVLQWSIHCPTGEEVPQYMSEGIWERRKGLVGW